METIDYFLRRYREGIIQRKQSEPDIESQLAAFEQRLRQNRGQYELTEALAD